jgi:hypothetical protein
MVYSQEIKVLLLNAYANFFHCNYVRENFTTHNTLRTLFPVYELISKTECQEVRLIFSRPFFSVGEPSTVELVAPNTSISLSTLLDCFKSYESIFTQLYNHADIRNSARGSVSLKITPATIKF